MDSGTGSWLNIGSIDEMGNSSAVFKGLSVAETAAGKAISEAAGVFTAAKLAYDQCLCLCLLQVFRSHPLMGSLQQFMFGTREGKRGEFLPFTRWDIVLSVILGVAFMAMIAYSTEPHGAWTLKRGLLVGAILIFVICTAQNRKVALGCAFSLVALRMGIGAMTGPHPLAFASTGVSVAYKSGPGIIAGILGGQVALTGKAAEALGEETLVAVGKSIPIVGVSVSTGALLYDGYQTYKAYSGCLSGVHE